MYLRVALPPKKNRNPEKKSKEKSKEKSLPHRLVLIISHCKFQLKTLHVLKSNHRKRELPEKGGFAWLYLCYSY